MIRVDLWEECLETLANANRTTTRTASAMRGGEGFVEIDVHDIEAHIARTTYAKHRVEVGTIVVHECATIVDELGNLRYLALEESEGVRVGHHHGSHAVVEQALEVVDIHHAIGGALDLDNL